MKKGHIKQPSHYNQQTTTAAVIHTHPGHPGVVVTQTVPMHSFVPGYVPYQYNPNQFFPMQQQPAPQQNVHGHEPHLHGHMHGYNNLHGHK